MKEEGAAQDKIIERDRYDRRARFVLNLGDLSTLGPDGAAGVPAEIRAPYLDYEAHIRRIARPGWRALDVCCGNGLHSLTAAIAGAEVAVTDIAAQNVTLTLQRAARAGLQMEGRVADAEQMPWPDASFDLVTCAGSLSYVELDVFLLEIRRILRPDGWFVCVDSLDHNPVYRFNRYLHYRRGQRSWSVIRRTPTLRTIAALKSSFPQQAKAEYYGVFSILAPMSLVVGARRTAAIIDGLDRMLPCLRRYAFKFVFCGALPALPVKL